MELHSEVANCYACTHLQLAVRQYVFICSNYFGVFLEYEISSINAAGIIIRTNFSALCVIKVKKWLSGSQAIEFHRGFFIM